MNHAATSREELLAASLRLTAEEGFASLNMRRVAREAGVSVGCVYRYFSTKAELTAAAVGKVWESIFDRADRGGAMGGFPACAARLYDCIRSGSDEYPAFFVSHALFFGSAEKGEGRAAMEHCLDRVRAILLAALAADSRVRPDIFGGDFTPESLVALVFDHLLLLATKGAQSCTDLIALLVKLLY